MTGASADRPAVSGELDAVRVPSAAIPTDAALRTPVVDVPCNGTEPDPAMLRAEAHPVMHRSLRTAMRTRAAPVSVDMRLLTIAADHLARLGAKRVTVVAVAAEAGMTHANVYRYFPSKYALLDAVAGRWLRDVEAELARIADAPDPADDKMERLLTTLAVLQREAFVLEPNLFAVHLDATVLSRPIARRHRVRLRSLVERVVEEGIAAGAFLVRDRERAIAYIFDASYRFTHPVAIHHDADVPRDLVEARLGAVIHAIQRVLRTGML